MTLHNLEIMLLSTCLTDTNLDAEDPVWAWLATLVHKSIILAIINYADSQH